MREQESKPLIDYRLAQASEALKDAEFLLGDGRYRAVANRLYYAAFYAVIAVLLTKRLEYARRSAVIAFFDREFIRTGILPREYSRTLHRAFGQRQQDDYMPFVEIEPDELRQLFVSVQAMIRGISDYVRGDEHDSR